MYEDMSAVLTKRSRMIGTRGALRRISRYSATYGTTTPFGNYTNMDRQFPAPGPSLWPVNTSSQK